eukprot:Phypoly_transcript_00203.p1 GENE.Phypoly_transcript_00203~~Phypoly_transcript_00203.p1  ORF type:complete len:1178 (-),score=157.51 Phypoly_transcript_00203:119-3652(-)
MNPYQQLYHNFVPQGAQPLAHITTGRQQQQNQQGNKRKFSQHQANDSKRPKLESSLTKAGGKPLWTEDTARHAMNEFCTKLNIPSEFDTIGAGPDHNKYFEASIKIPVQGTIVHAVGTGRNKKDAIKYAAVDACMKLEAMGLLGNPSKAIAQTTQTAFPLDQAKNHLIKYCNKFKWPGPKYNVYSEGPNNATVFTIDVVVPISYTESKVVGRGVGTSKKEAESKAAIEACTYLHNEGKIKNKSAPPGVSGSVTHQKEGPIPINIDNQMVTAIAQVLYAERALKDQFKSTTWDPEEGGYTNRAFEAPPVHDLEQASAQLLEKYDKLQSDPQYVDILQARKKLPVYNYRSEILKAVAKNRVIVVSGATGSGKTTQIPQFVMEEMIESKRGAKCNIIVTQPRRISAIGVAERVAFEKCEPLGQSVGYTIRLETVATTSPAKLLFCTTGVLLRKLQADPTLKTVSHLFMDEIHERDINSDILLMVLHDVLKKTDVKVVLMSATLDATLFSKYFGGCPIIDIPGRTFPVTDYFLEDIDRMIGKPHHNEEEIDNRLIEDLILHICNKTPPQGGILVFLPGWDEIQSLNGRLRANPRFSNPQYFLIIPLHSSVASIHQRSIFSRPAPGCRKIVISTNIAETSITIDDIVYVIDAGRVKTKTHSTSRAVTHFGSQWISKASAMQRRGRAGRVQPGECYKLYTTTKFETFTQFQVPELLRIPLYEVCLQIKTLQKGKIADILARAIEPPQSHAVQAAVSLLQDLGALDANENMTILGKHLARLPLDPRMGKMIILGTIFQCLDPVLTIAVCHSSSNDPFVIPAFARDKADAVHVQYSLESQSDHIALVNAYMGFAQALATGTERDYCDRNFLSLSNLKLIMKSKEQLIELLRESKFLDESTSAHVRGAILSPASNVNSSNNELVKGIVCAGLFPNIARHSGKKREFGSKVDKLLLLHPASTIYTMNKAFKSPWVVFSEKVQTTKCFIKTASILSDFALFLFGGRLRVDPTPAGGATVLLDEWPCFSIDSYNNVALLVEMRAALDRFIYRRIEAPHTPVTPLDASIVFIILQLVSLPSLSMTTPAFLPNPNTMPIPTPYNNNTPYNNIPTSTYSNNTPTYNPTQNPHPNIYQNTDYNNINPSMTNYGYGEYSNYYSANYTNQTTNSTENNYTNTTTTTTTEQNYANA